MGAVKVLVTCGFQEIVCHLRVFITYFGVFVYVKNLLSSKDGVQPSSFHTKITIKPLEKIGNYSGEGENGA